MSSQLRPLLSLRWLMVRSARARRGFLALALTTPLLSGLAAAAARLAPDDARNDVILLAPTALVPVAVLAVLAPLVAGGGNELFPDDHLTAYPVSSRTVHAASLLLTPLNLAWVIQVVGLVAMASFIAERGRLLVLPVITILAYVVLVTVAGQAAGWWLTGLRQHRTGRIVTWAVAAVLVLGSVLVVATGRLPAVLNRTPTTAVIVAALDGSAGAWGTWSITTVVLLALTLLAYLAGARACDWSLRQPGDTSGSLGRSVRRRVQPGSARTALLATDRASVWRSPSLRRGLLVLGILPGLVAAVAGLDWTSLVLLPALVAAGAGLLFGVNVFCLDGSGALWLASHPGDPPTAFWCKAQVVAEACLVAVAVTLAAGSLRADRAPTAAEAVAILACAGTTLLRVLATCMDLSVNRPHRAELRGPRDTPAPPGAMAAYSVRLAVTATLTGMTFSALSGLDEWRWSAALALPLGLMSLRRLLSSAHKWSDPRVRSGVVATVSSG